MANPDKIWVLKVSIHCEGCKRKVHKIISNIQGVEKVDIDLKQHKVSVRGTVDPRTVIWKLEKAGKHAELWPEREKPAAKEGKRPGKDQSMDKQSSSQDKDRARAVQESSGGEEKPSVKGKGGDGEGKDAVDTRNDNGGDNGGKGSKGSLDGKASGSDEGEMVQKPTDIESRADAVEKETVKRAVNVPGGGKLSTDANGDKVGEGSGGNKKKKKGQKGKKESSECDEVHSGEGKAGGSVPGGPGPNNGSPNQGPQRHTGAQRPEHRAQSQGPVCAQPPEEFPAHNYGYYDHPPPPPTRYYGPPVYAVNYHTARPSSSYGASQYYDPQPPLNSYHAYTHPRPEDRQPYYDPYYQRPSEPFQLFSDENPNACSLM